MERLVPPHAPVGPLNGCVLPIRWEFPRYTSFQSWRPQRVLHLSPSSNQLLIWRKEPRRLQIFSSVCDSRGSVVVVRLQETELVQMSFMVLVTFSFYFFQSTGGFLVFEAENMRAEANRLRLPRLPSELTDRRRLGLPCLTALFRGLWKLPSSPVFRKS